MPRTVGVLVFDEVEVLDFAGPFEVFSVARAAGQGPDSPILFRPFIIAEEQRLISARGSLQIQPHYSIDFHPPLDILVVPGEAGRRRPHFHARVVDWIAAQDRRTGHVITSCGVSPGIEMALHIVARLYGDATAAWTARRLEYQSALPAAAY
jgi:transcriptional regulator GlxA family with amidase domain